MIGIAHHQRPGFLSYPSSHTVPYLRTNKFPKEIYPEMYEYREIKSRLLKKIVRALSSVADLDQNISRSVIERDAANIRLPETVDAIITSPPYMGQVDYARDNRLRVYLMGISDWQSLNQKISPNAAKFSEHFEICLHTWRKNLKHGGKLAILVGTTTNSVKKRLDTLVINLISNKWKDYKLTEVIESEIPDARRARKNCKGSTAESVLIVEYK